METDKHSTADMAGSSNIQTKAIISASSNHTRNFELQCGNRTLSMVLNFTPGPLKLSDMVPTARGICDKLVEATLADPKTEATCVKGCSHCCNYVVPISHPEAAMIYREINSMPQYKRKPFIERSLSAAKQILETKNLPTPKKSTAQDIKAGLYEISSWYTDLNLPCPFLEDSSCAIYESRPLACREHLVKSPASKCKLGSKTPPEKIIVPTSVTRALSNTSCKLKSLRTSSIMLPFIFPWMDSNKIITEQTWPAELVVDTFIDELQKLAKETRKVKKKFDIVEIKTESRIPIQTLPASNHKELSFARSY